VASSSIQLTARGDRPVGASPGGARRLLAELTRPRWARLMFPVVFVLVWQLAVPMLESQLIPLPSEVLEKMVDQFQDGVVQEHFTISLRRFAIGLVITILIGTLLGLAMGMFRHFEAAVHDFVVGGLTFPYLVTALLVAMWFGFGGWGPILVLITTATPFIAINLAEGVRGVPKELMDMAHSYGVGWPRILRHLVLPSLSPFFFAALRYAVSSGWRALVLAEVFAATSGAGWYMSMLWRDGNTAGLIGLGFYFVIFALLLDQLFEFASRRVFRWRPAKVVAARAPSSAV
jgi:ABC-type nitrate/sulfonate/bicarbonate transport system permease component